MYDFSELDALIELQQESMENVDSHRIKMTKAWKSIYVKEDQDYWRRCFQNLRRIDVKTLENAGCFFIPDDVGIEYIPEEFRQDSFGLVKKGRHVYSGRFVFPVMDLNNQVAGWVGYDKFEEPKYLDSRNYGYVAKSTMLYGMEKMRYYYSNDKPVFVTEGVICMLYLRQQGYQALALLGSYMSPYVKQILNRLGNRAVIIPDTDDAGYKLKRSKEYNLKLARLYRPSLNKDIDDTRMEHEEDLLEDIEKICNNKINLKTLTKI